MENSRYWDHVRQNGGVESSLSNPDLLGAVPPAERTHYGRLLAAWLAVGYPMLSERQKEVFREAFYRGRSDEDGSQALRLSHQRYANIKSRVRAIMAKFLGIPRGAEKKYAGGGVGKNAQSGPYSARGSNGDPKAAGLDLNNDADYEIYIRRLNSPESPPQTARQYPGQYRTPMRESVSRRTT